ncbi:MAG: phage tail protein [Synechococcaceae cyanobacterium]
MNVNGARFHLLLGAEDWRRCRGADGANDTPLGDLWDAQERAGTILDGLPGWDRQRQLLTLASLPVSLPLTRGEPLYDAASRRGAAVDRFGNLYVVSDDRRALLVDSEGSGEGPTPFWPDGREQPVARDQDSVFTDAVPAPPRSCWLGPLAITSDDFLVAVQSTAEGRVEGVLRFDLVAGGPPDTLLFPEGFAPNVADMAADGRGGLWLLDRGDGVRPGALFRLDERMAPIASASPSSAPDLFQPLQGEPRLLTLPAPITGMALAAVTAPTALLALDEALILMGAPDAGPARLFCLDPGASAPRALGPVPGPAFALAGRGLSDGEVELLLAARNGNQAWRVRLERIQGLWQSRAEADVVPLRRFGGRALVCRGRIIVYDSGPRPLWVPAVALPRQVFATRARFTTPVPAWDGGEPQCVWDRLRLDACIPPGTAVRVEARASDDPEDLAPGEAGWRLQPQPYLNSDGGELPGKGPAAMAATNGPAGRGCWDLLLQEVVGRYLQLRLTLSGDGRFSPQLRAIRAWYPRVSWTRFLPAIYRAEPGPADFLDRFLANMEGLSSGIEGRIVAAQALFDPRFAPAESLEWLAGWLDTALDPAWDEDRRRLFIAHAADFFAWRGTMRGLSLALRLAFQDPTLSALDFSAWEADGGPHAWDRPGGIRIAESYSVRRSGRLWPTSRSDGTAATGLRQVSLETRWQPEAGSAGLLKLWALSGGETNNAEAQEMDPRERLAGVDLSGEGRDPLLWERFCLDQFGFLPAIGAAERARWQSYSTSLGLAASEQPRGEVPAAIAAAWAGFVALQSPLRQRWHAYLEARHRSIGRLNGAWGSNWAAFGEIPIPDRLPGSVAASLDWLIFEGQILPMAAAAHRFSVLLPRRRVDHDPGADAADLALAARIVALEKPAHTIFDVRFYWAMNRVGEARLGRDSQLGTSSRAPELLPPALLGRAWVGSGMVGGPPGSAVVNAATVRRQRLC